MLRAEYEQCEDYWAAKLEEERQLFEQEQKVSSDNFTELITKMAEYEEQFNQSEKHNDGRLSPIEEKVNLEQQYNDLEEEFERWRADAHEELTKRERELDELKAKLAASQQQQERQQLSLQDISVQFPDEQMKNMYPTLYDALCTPGGSNSESGSAKIESTMTAGEAKNSSLQQCPQVGRVSHFYCMCVCKKESVFKRVCN